MSGVPEGIKDAALNRVSAKGKDQGLAPAAAIKSRMKVKYKEERG